MINCYFDGAYTSVTSHPAYLHDYGQILRVFDLDLPAVVEAHFALEESGESILRMGTCEKGITHIPIPDSCLEETGSFYCYIFDRDNTSGRTVYKIKIPVLKRADMPTETTEPSEQDVAYFEQVLAQIEQKAEEINSAVVSTAPYVVEFDTVGSGDSALCTCRQTYADVIDALASGRSVMAVEYRYSQSTDDDPYQTRYHCLIGAGTSQIKFGENGLTYINGRDPGYGDGWMITAPYIILKSNGTVVRTSATGSPAMMGDVNSLTKETGDALASLKADLEYKADLPTESEKVSYTPELSKLINSNGVITSLINTDNKWRVTGYIPVSVGEKYQITAMAINNNSYYAFYSSDYSVIANQKAISESSYNTFSGVVNIPQSASYMCVAYYVDRNDKDVEIKKITPKSVNLRDVDALSGNYEYNTIPIECVLTPNKHINGNTGAISSVGNNKWAITSAITVTSGEEYLINATMFYYNGVIAVYDSSDNLVDVVSSNAGTLISANTYEFKNYYYRIPTGGTKMIIGVYTDYSYSVGKITGYDLIAKTYPWKGKKWACVGDSLTNGNTRTTKYYYDYVAEDTGITTVNMGDSGSGYAKEQDVNTAFYQRISSVPLDSDVVTIFGSFNDLTSGLSLGTKTDSGTTTIAGCINETIDALYTAYPLANLGIVTPTPWNNANPLTEPNTASQYVDMIKNICAMRGIPCLDLFHCSGLRPWESSYRTTVYSNDGDNGVHPNEIGHRIIASHFKAFLDTLLSASIL